MLLVINIFVFLYCPSSPLLTPGVWYEAAGVLAARAAVGPGEGLSPCTETVRHSAGTRRRPAGGRQCQVVTPGNLSIPAFVSLCVEKCVALVHIL